MDGQLRGQATRQPQQTEVLHDQGIDTGQGACPDQAGGALQLLVEHQDIQGHIAPHAMRVQCIHDLAELGHADAFGADPRIQAVIQPEIHRIGTGIDRRPQLGRATGRGQQLGDGVQGRWYPRRVWELRSVMHYSSP